MIQVGLLGADGRMGQWVSRLVGEDYAGRVTLATQVSRGDPLEPLLGADVVIDFSSPAAFLNLAELALKSKGPLPAFVVGSTGWKSAETRIVEALAERASVLMSSNFSTGALALQHILRDASPMLHRLGYAPVLVETHHRHKKDAPSGTALLLSRAIETSGKYESVPVHSVRAGEVIGDHEITFYGPADHLVLGHFAQDRSIFARGAIDAALWLHRRKAQLAPQRKILAMEAFFTDLQRESRDENV